MYGIGIGQSDFRALRIRKNYYIDKTMYIKDIIDNEASVILVTRPRRFGKTLNMSMLKYYFDCTKKGETGKLEEKQKEAREQIERYSSFDDIKDIQGLRKYTIVVASNDIYVEEII